jgi:hypothetical protein
VPGTGERERRGNMNSEALMPLERIEKSIYLIRGQKVMLDRDLAALYEVETRVLNQAVTRNMPRFPDDFMFELTREEIMRISQTVTSSSDLKFSKKVRAFTEQGVAMLSAVLRSPRAIDVSIAITRTFVKLRRMLEPHTKLAQKMSELEDKYDEQFRIVFEVMSELMSPPEPKRKQIGFAAGETQSGVSPKKQKGRRER